MKEITEKNAQYSEEKLKSSEKKSSRNWKSLAAQATNSERTKRTSGSIKHNNVVEQEREGRSQVRESGAKPGKEGKRNIGL